jgi:outer membrane receptor protein involved in Fe transport
MEMSRLALSDAADALTKVTGTTIVDGKYIVVRGLGDRYSTAQLNGLEMPSTDPYRNSPQLDIIPSSLLDNIITSKTFTPDQPGNFTGGNVNLKTKDFPEQRTYSISVGVGYNTLATFNDDFITHRGGSNDYFGYDDGTRALPARLVEIGELEVPAGTGSPGSVRILTPDVNRLLVTDEENQQAFDLVEEASDLLDSDFDIIRSAPTLNHSISLSYGNQHLLKKNRRIGYVFNANFSRDYNHYDDGINAIYKLDDGGADVLNQSFDFSDTRSAEMPSVGAFGSFSYKLADGQTLNAIGVYNHTTEISTRYLNGSAPELNIDDPDFLENRAIRFLERSTTNVQLNGQHALNKSGDLTLDWSAGYTLSSQSEPNFRLFANTVSLVNDEVRYNIQSASYSRPQSFFRELEDEQWEYKMDLAKSFDSGHKLQVGGSYRNKVRDFSESIYELQTNERNEIVRYSGDPRAYFSDENSGFLDSTARSTPTTTRAGIANWVVDNTLLQNSYDGEETIAAVYGMGTYAVSKKFRIIAGARLESTDIEVTSRDQTLPDSFRIGRIDALDLLPSLNLVYSPNSNSNFRFSVTQTLARPNMREIALFPSFDFIGGPTFSGNPRLQRTNVTNLDLRYEYFLSNGGLLSASAFYKDFSDPIVSTFLAAGQLEFTYVNVEEATVYGIELEARKDLGFINPQLVPLTVGANLSIIESEVPINPVEAARNGLPEGATRPFQGQSPYIVNANISWAPRGGSFDASLAFNYFGDRLAFNGAEGTPDVYERGRQSLDFIVTKRLGSLTLRAVAANLINPAYETFATFKDQDFVFTQFRRGRTFKLSVGYTFGR